MMAALSTLDDRMLMDIGIHRGEIERVVDGFDDREMQMTPVAPAAKPVAIAPETLPRAA